jgi:hypothetical protein
MRDLHPGLERKSPQLPHYHTGLCKSFLGISSIKSCHSHHFDNAHMHIIMLVSKLNCGLFIQALLLFAAGQGQELTDEQKFNTKRTLSIGYVRKCHF